MFSLQITNSCGRRCYFFSFFFCMVSVLALQFPFKAIIFMGLFNEYMYAGVFKFACSLTLIDIDILVM